MSVKEKLSKIILKDEQRDKLVVALNRMNKEYVDFVSGKSDVVPGRGE